jgi:hypothetical protein
MNRIASQWCTRWAYAIAMSVLSVIVSSSAQAQSENVDPIFQSAYPLRPASGGWYQPTSNLGNINFDVSDSGDVAGNWSTFRDAKPIWYYFQGRIEYSSDAEAMDTGVIATADVPLVEVLTAGQCPTCDFIPPVFSEPMHRMRIEFTSSRTARFIYDGQASRPIVAWMQGAPLFSHRDYSGDWLAIAREDSANFNATTRAHTEAIAHVRLEALEGGEKGIATSTPSNPYGAITPPADARRYKVSCVGPARSCQLLMDRGVLFGESGAGEHFPLLWIDATETGHVVRARVVGESYSLTPYAIPYRVYASQDSVTAVRSKSSDRSTGVSEIVLKKLPDGVFDGRQWGNLSSSNLYY